MRVLRCLRAIGALLPACAPPLAAQGWDAPEAIALVRRAVDQRAAVQADSMLLSYRTRAHGFVFFLAQVGEGLTEPPRLVKADELDVEVYWQAPNHSKQVVLGWRDGAFLPTDIEYHRDHLGIVTNNFGDLIRIGEGDEVRDAIHPLSRAGLALYDYALGDSLTIRTGGGEVTVREVQVRPRSFERPLVVGTMFIDIETAELVRFRFSFTPSAYLDRQLEDITIVLENARFEGRWWLPYRQEIEIRRRASFLDFPARGIIRGRWEIEDYDLNVEIPPEVLAGPAIGGLVRPQPGDSGWDRAALGRDRGCRRADQRAGHGGAPGRGRANRRLTGPGRPSLEPARDRLAERPRSGEPGAGPRARLRWHDRHRGPVQSPAADRLRHLGRARHRRPHAARRDGRHSALPRRRAADPRLQPTSR